jgi:F-type H+-transporting ATPase subunit b
VEHFVLKFAAEEAGGTSGFGALGIDGQAFLIQLVTFLLVFFVLRKYVFGRVVKLLEDRRKTIEQGVKLTNEMTVAKSKLEEEIVAARKKSRVEADQIIADSHERAGAMLKEAEDAAQRKVDAILADAHKKIEEETDRARRNLEKDMVELVIQATEIVAKEKIDSKKDHELIQQALRGQA